MTIADWPAGEGPREKLLKRGVGALSDAELLAVILRTGCSGCNAVELGRVLLEHFGGLARLLAAQRRELQLFRGLGDAKFSQLQTVLELARRQSLEVLENTDVLTDPQKTRTFLHYHLRSRPREVFSCLFLNSQHAVICCEDLFWGTLDGAAVYPREVAVRALYHNASAVIFAHNHPSGVAEPSHADRRITERLQAALALLDIRVLDHIIVGCGQQFSFAERGLL